MWMRSLRRSEKDLSQISSTIDNTQIAIGIIANGADSSATQTQTQSEKTNEIQERLEHTNQTAAGALETTEKPRGVIETGKNESDELAKTVRDRRSVHRADFPDH